MSFFSEMFNERFNHEKYGEISFSEKVLLDYANEFWGKPSYVIKKNIIRIGVFALLGFFVGEFLLATSAAIIGTGIMAIHAYILKNRFLKNRGDV